MVDHTNPDETPEPTQRSRRPISLTRKLAFSAIIWLAVFGTPELLLRLFWTPTGPKTPAVGTRQFVNWLSRLSEDEKTTKPIYRSDPKLLWSLDPGTSITSFNHHFAPDGEKQSINVTINDEGYRGQSLTTIDTNSRKILCLGDSNFFGYPLDDQQTFPAVLEATLQKHCPSQNWRVVNGGVPGYTVIQGWLWHQQAFRDHKFDVLLLSFLNNDAWRQPQHDLDLLSNNSSIVHTLGGLARYSRIVNWLESTFRTPIPKSKFVPRVEKKDFVAYYRRLIDLAENTGTRVMILDYRAYDQYAPYSIALKQLADERRVEYVAIAPRIAAAIDKPETLAQYPTQVEKVRRRWGTELLNERPYLWYFAEFHPEHLNEVGVALLTDQLKDSLCKESE